MRRERAGELACGVNAQIELACGVNAVAAGVWLPVCKAGVRGRTSPSGMKSPPPPPSEAGEAISQQWKNAGSVALTTTSSHQELTPSAMASIRLVWWIKLACRLGLSLTIRKPEHASGSEGGCWVGGGGGGGVEAGGCGGDLFADPSGSGFGGGGAPALGKGSAGGRRSVVGAGDGGDDEATGPPDGGGEGDGGVGLGDGGGTGDCSGQISRTRLTVQ